MGLFRSNNIGTHFKVTKTSFSLFYLIVSIVIIALLYFVNRSALTLVSILIMFIGLFIHPVIPGFVYLAFNIFGASAGSTYQFIMMGIVVLSSVYIMVLKNDQKRNRLETKTFVYIFLLLILAFFSYLLGVDANINTLLIFVFVWVYYITIRSIASTEDKNLIIVGLFMIGLVMLGAIVFQYLSGNLSFLYGSRLGFEDSVRQLSNAIAFPIFYSFWVILNGNEGTGNRFKTNRFSVRLIFTLFFAFATFILLQTYSRGVIFSLALVFIFILIRSFRNVHSKSLFITIIGILLVLIAISSGIIDITMMTHEVSTGNGRLFIWTEFWRMMENGGLHRVLFGFGPGDLHRISAGTSINGYYAHSLFLDYLFSYGVLGFLMFITIVLSELKRIFKSKNLLGEALSILTILLFLTHGVCTSFLFYFLFALGTSFGESIPKQISIKES